MNKLNSPGSNRFAIQVLVASAAAALLSGCSADATRFDNPFSSPFASNGAAKPQHVASSKPTGIGRSPPVVAQALPPRTAPVASAAPVGVSHETTGSIQAASASPRVVPGASFGGWSAIGGTSVVVAQGDNADSLSKRYGVPENVLLQVNGLKSGAEVQPGSKITVPIYNASAMAGASAAPVHVAVVAPAPLVHPVSSPRTRVAVLSAPAVLAPPVAARVVVAPARVAKIVVGAPGRVVVAAARPGKVVVVAPARVAIAAPLPQRLLKGAVLVKTASLEPAARVRVAAVAPAGPRAVIQKVVVVASVPAAKAERLAAPAAPKAVDQTPTASVQPAAPAVEAAGGPEFRWPARGRIIQGFKGGAGGNDGINIAVPEGTAVKAAEGGTVIYAGTEMKAYGSMVLIRHPNGFISAYANNGEIDVKKGDAVKRGQIIAKSGQSGNVSSPQLHFELRKGQGSGRPDAVLGGALTLSVPDSRGDVDIPGPRCRPAARHCTGRRTETAGPKKGPPSFVCQTTEVTTRRSPCPCVRRDPG